MTAEPVSPHGVGRSTPPRLVVAEPKFAVIADPGTDLWTVHQADARNTATFLEGIAAARGQVAEPFIGATITSPPYANLVDYGVSGQIGFQQSYEKYLDECKSIFEALFKWTKNDGSLWVVADSVVRPATNGEPGRLIPLPFDLSELATRAGWVLRDVVIWRKDRTRPWSNRGRLRNGFEYVLYFVKSKDYKYHVDRLRDSRALKSWWVKYPERHNPWGMAPDNVWEIPIPVQGSWASPELRHACPFPIELVRRMIMLSTDEGDVVFDPFAGSGMVAAVSEAESRLALGTELNLSFVEAFHDSVRPTVLSNYQQVESNRSEEMTRRLLTLRVLKYPKDLMRQLFREGVERSGVRAAVVSALPFDEVPKTSRYADVTCTVLIDDLTSDATLEQIMSVVGKLEARPPLSKYSLEVSVLVKRLGDFLIPDGTSLTVYRRGRTWSGNAVLTAENLLEVLDGAAVDEFPPILSPLSIVQVLEEN